MAEQPWQLLPELSAEEFAALKADIAAFGLRVPIVVDAATGEVVDGHHRQRALDELRAEGVKVADYRDVRAFGSDEERLAYVLGANLFRRHLDRKQRAELVAKLRERGWSLRRIGEVVGAGKSTVADDLANVRGRTIPERVERKGGGTYPSRRPAVIVTNRKAEERARAALATLGDEAPGRLLALKDAEKLARRVEWERKRDAMTPVPSAEGDRWELRQGDFADVLGELAPESVDLVLTDPPYEAAFISEWGRLGEACARVLKPGAVAAFYSGHHRLDYIMAQLSEHLSWLWHVVLVQGAAEARMNVPKVHNGHRDLLVYSKDRYEPKRWLRDTITSAFSERADKAMHPWQQAAVAPRYLVDIICPDGGLVADPCCGSGTFGVAALTSERRPQFLGVELDPAVLAIAAERLRAASAERVPDEDGAS
jgi:site-specific DNA-methyltransferase (adenine-specific)